MRNVLLALVAGVLFTDWAHLRFRHHALEAENASLHLLVARYEQTGNSQDMALHSCRSMLDDFVDARQRSAIFAVTSADQLKKRRIRRGRLVAFVASERHHGILQEAP